MSLCSFTLRYSALKDPSDSDTNQLYECRNLTDVPMLSREYEIETGLTEYEIETGRINYSQDQYPELDEFIDSLHANRNGSHLSDPSTPGMVDNTSDKLNDIKYGHLSLFTIQKIVHFTMHLCAIVKLLVLTLGMCCTFTIL